MRVEDEEITLGQTSVFHRRARAAGTPLLYLHGIPTSSDDWLGCLARTGGLAPDLPGFGRSGKAGNLDYTLAGQAEFIERYLDQLGVRKVMLVGHDWGAGAGLVFAQAHPERVQRLVIVNALPLLEGFRWRAMVRWLRRPGIGELLIGSVNRRLLARDLRHACAHPEAISPEAVKAAWAQFDQGTQRAILRLHRSAPEPALAAAGAGLSSLQMPSLVIWGARDPWFAARFGEAYAQALPNSELELIADAGHWPWLEAPALLERIAAFTLAVDGAGAGPGAGEAAAGSP